MAYYYLGFIADNHCEMTIQVNGFPVRNGKVSKNFYNNIIINGSLIGKNNKVVISLLTDNQQRIQLKFNVRLYREGDKVSPQSGESIPMNYVNTAGELKQVDSVSEFLDSSVGKVETNTYQFNNEGYDFSELFLGESFYPEEQQLLEYGQYIIDLYKTKNFSQLMREEEYRILYHTKTTNNDAATVEKELTEILAEAMATGYVQQREGDVIKMRPWCNHRVFEIYMERPDSTDPELLKIVEKKEGSTAASLIAVFVSVKKGEIKIVR